LGNVYPIEGNAALGGRQKFGEQVEKGRFTCTIGADEGVNVTAFNFEINLIDGHEAFELFGQSTRFKDELGCQIEPHLRKLKCQHFTNSFENVSSGNNLRSYTWVNKSK
jgi:hypothetical protein